MNKKLRNNLGRPQVLTIKGKDKEVKVLRALSYQHFDSEVTEEELKLIIGIEPLIAKGYVTIQDSAPKEKKVKGGTQ